MCSKGLIKAMDFTLESQIVVKYGDQTWSPPQITIDEVRYFQFSKWDRHFVRWVTGKSLDLRKDKSAGSADCEYLDKILHRRQTACDDALHAALHHGEEGQSKTKKRRRRANSSDAHLVSRVLNMTLPEVPDEGLAEKLVRILFDGAGTANIYMEMHEDILYHLKKGIQQSSRNDRSRKKAAD